MAGLQNRPTTSTTKTKKKPKLKYKHPAGNLSDFDNSPLCGNQHKQPPEGIGMPTLVPFIRRNVPQSARTATPQPAALFVPCHAGNSYRLLEKISHHTELSASICTAVAAAID
jgi:hypothetical protein